MSYLKKMGEYKAERSVPPNTLKIESDGDDESDESSVEAMDID